MTSERRRKLRRSRAARALAVLVQLVLDGVGASQGSFLSRTWSPASMALARRAMS